MEYVERIEQYFVANGINDDGKKKGILLTVVGSETYSLLRSLVSPAKSSEKTLEEIIETLKNHLNLTPIKLAERYNFYQRNQQTGESLSKYLAELRKMSEHCQFGIFLNDALCDKLVCGMSNSSIRKRFREKP